MIDNRIRFGRMPAIYDMISSWHFVGSKLYYSLENVSLRRI
jgi:hypothetical protein